MGGTYVAIVGWLVGMRAQRDHNHSYWFGLVGVGGARLRKWGCLRVSCRAWAARVERVQKWVKSSSNAGYRLFSESRYMMW